MTEAFEALPDWAQWLSAIAGGLLAIATIWRLGVVNLGHALWKAILAAPMIAEGIQDLGDLIRGDVLGQIASSNARILALEDRAVDQRAELLDQRQLVTALQVEIARQQASSDAQNARLAVIDLAVVALRTSEPS